MPDGSYYFGQDNALNTTKPAATNLLTDFTAAQEYAGKNRLTLKVDAMTPNLRLSFWRENKMVGGTVPTNPQAGYCPAP